jgi:hypothetical protein
VPEGVVNGKLKIKNNEIKLSGTVIMIITGETS